MRRFRPAFAKKTAYSAVVNPYIEGVSHNRDFLMRKFRFTRPAGNLLKAVFFMGVIPYAMYASIKYSHDAKEGDVQPPRHNF